MVYISDEGSVFDLPLEGVWGYLSSDAHKHPSMNLISREVQENVVTITSERNVDGKMVRSKVKITLFPPLGIAQEYVEGPMAGSKAFTHYAPKGGKTVITVVGDFKMAGISDEEATKKAVMQILELSFNEDTDTLRKIK